MSSARPVAAVASRPDAAQEEFDRLVEAALPSVVGATLAAGPGRVYRAVMARMELPLLRHALELSGGNQLRAARLLGINRNTLRKRLRQLGILPSPAAAAREGEDRAPW
jgi:two-component system, NtrC family, nitrogen regulation response regulator GlnG